jgi:hypothetical protein
MAEIYFVERWCLYVGIIDGLVVGIQRGSPRTINPHAIVVATFDATFEAIHVADGKLYLDGFALTDLMAWLYRQMPNATFTAFGRRFFKFFPGSPFISDLVRATFRCATGNEHQARGEDAYYCRKVREAHPVEFAELRNEWSRRLSVAIPRALRCLRGPGLHLSNGTAGYGWANGEGNAGQRIPYLGRR